MADPRIVTIGAGQTYPDLATAIATETYKSPSTDNGNGGPGMLYYDCYNLSGGVAEAPSAVIDAAGYTCDVNNYLVIRGAPSELNANNRGKWATDRYRIEPANNVSGLRLGSAYVRVRDLQVNIAAVAGGGNYAYASVSANTRAERCIARCHGSITNTGDYVGYLVAGATGTAGFICVNCLAYDFHIGAESRGYGFKGGATGNYLHCYNCTVSDSYRGYWQTDGRVYCYNCGEAYRQNSGFSSVYSQDHCSFGASPTFKDRAADDYHLDAADTVWKGQGADQSGVLTDDIDGDTRGGAWDIGFDQATIPRNPVPMGFIVG